MSVHTRPNLMDSSGEEESEDEGEGQSGAPIALPYKPEPAGDLLDVCVCKYVCIPFSFGCVRLVLVCVCVCFILIQILILILIIFFQLQIPG